MTANHNGKSTWSCLNRTCRAAIGYVAKAIIDGYKITCLYVYAQPADSTTPAVIAKIDGPATITCQRCGCERKWIPGEEAIHRLIRAYA